MAFWQNVLTDRIVGAVGASSPGTGFTSVANFPTLVGNARTQKLPLYLLPGTYPSTQLSITSGNPLVLSAEKGTATIQFSGGSDNLFFIQNVSDCKLQGLLINGNNATFTNPGQLTALVNIQGSGVAACIISDCTIYNSTHCGISCSGNAYTSMINNLIYSCDAGIWSIDGTVYINKNTVQYCNNNGILVQASTATNVNGSEVSSNYISDISNASGGSGQYGNGINVFRAGGVKILNNTIYRCNYTSIRINIAGNCQVIGNHCSVASGDVAIYFEAPGPGGGGTTLIGGIFANNIVDTATTGISIANSGLYDDGVTRRITISGNQVTNVTSYGIQVEGSCDVVGNIVETASIGIVLGTNDATKDLVASGNYVTSCNMGIGYSANAAAKNILVSSNLVTNYVTNSNPAAPGYARSGAIVSVSYATSPGYTRDSVSGAANTDHGNDTHTVVGSLTVGMNRAG